MKSFAQNSDSTTKWLTPDVVQYIGDREQLRTQLEMVIINKQMFVCCCHSSPGMSCQGIAFSGNGGGVQQLVCI